MSKAVSIDDLVGKKDTQLTKPTNQKETEVKNSNKKTIIVSVVSTLLVLAAIALVFIAGINYEQGRQDVIQKQAAELATKMSKTNQQ